MSDAGTSAEDRPSVLYAVKQVELAVRARLDDVLRPHGITAPQYTALTVLARRDGMTAAELARASFVTAQASTELVAALQRRALIARQPDPAHRRRLAISLTAQGRTLLTELAEPVAAIERQMLDGLSDGERDRLHDVLNRCRAALAGPPVRPRHRHPAI